MEPDNLIAHTDYREGVPGNVFPQEKSRRSVGRLAQERINILVLQAFDFGLYHEVSGLAEKNAGVVGINIEAF